MAAILSHPQCVKARSLLSWFDYGLHQPISTLRHEQNGWHFADNTFKSIFLDENLCILVQISPKFVPKCLIDSKSGFIQTMACISNRRQVITWTNHYQVRCMLSAGHNVLTHLPLDKMAAISQTIFSDAFLWLKSCVFWLKLHWSLFVRVQLTINNIGLDDGLAPNRRQAIIWTNAASIYWRIYMWH